MKILAFALAALMLTAAHGWADGGGNSQCKILPDKTELSALLTSAPGSGGDAGGLFHGSRMWAAVVNRAGAICSFATNQTDATLGMAGNQAIAKAKAYTANAFSLDSLALSTARLYTFTQPGHSLWSLSQSNLWDPEFTVPPSGQGGGKNQIAGD